MTPTAAILELLRERTKMSARQLADALAARDYRWPGDKQVNRDRVHQKLLGMMLTGQVRRQRVAGVWFWSET